MCWLNSAVYSMYSWIIPLILFGKPRNQLLSNPLFILCYQFSYRVHPIIGKIKLKLKSH